MLNLLSPSSWRSAAALGLLVGAAAMPQAHAQGRSTTMDLGQAAMSDVIAYWTPERLASAQPMLPRLATTPALSAGAPQARGAASSSPGQPPSVTRVFDEVTLIPGGMRPTAEPDSEAAPTAVSPGGFGVFTHSRVAPNSLASSYPYTTVGKLFFTVPGRGNGVCSASVIRRRIVLTAGHCVATAGTSAATRRFHTNFMFVPALMDGTGPFGAWTPTSVTVDNRWFFSNGSVPNAGDFGWLTIADRTISGASRRIGDMTGNLGWVTNALNGNVLTIMGYPCNLDSCNRMQMTVAPFNRDGGNNSAIYPSIMRGGASGGPWIQDFGTAPTGAPANTSGLNLQVGVTSYGPVSTAVYYLGSSRMDSTWLSIMNNVCSRAPAGSC